MTRSVLTGNAIVVEAIAGTVVFASSAGAQALEEVVVSATKRGTTLAQDTPVSLQAISGQGLAEIGALDFNDYYRRIPGLSVNDQGPGDKRYIIRGVNSSGTGTVGLYFDEIAITGDNIATAGGRQPDIKLFDMERIEVLRGPQGTTFGSSSLTGAIRWLPKEADLNEASFSGGAVALSTEESAGSGWQIDGAVNIPLVSDRLAVRLSGLTLDKKGYIDNRFSADANNDDTEALRGVVKWRIADGLDLSALGMYQHSVTNARPKYHAHDYQMAASPTLTGAQLPKFFNADLSRGLFDDEMLLANVKLVWERPWGSFTASSSRFDRDTQFERDTSAAVEVLSRGLLPADGAGRSILAQPKEDERRTHEIRFASTWNSPWQLLAGVFMQEDERHFESTIVTTSAASGQVTPASRVLQDRSTVTTVDEIAVFGELSWDITDRLTTTAGARWFEFDIAEQARVITGFPGTPGTGLGPLLKFGEDGVIGKFNVSYDLSDDVLTYLQIAEGFRSGGTNDTTIASTVGVTIPPGFESDSLVNYELGIKSSWLARSLVVNGSVYYIDWSNIQVNNFAVSETVGRFAYRGNGGRAEVVGLELELSAFVTDNLQVGLGFNYNNAELAQDLPIRSDGLKGDRIPFVPETAVNVNARYEHPLGDSRLSWFVGGDWSFSSKQTTLLRPTNPQYRQVDGYSILNLRAGVQGDSWSAVLGVDNALDEDETISYVFDFGGSPSNGVIPDGLVRPWPRTISLTLRKSFDLF